LIFIEAALLGIAAMKLDDDFIKNINISKNAQLLVVQKPFIKRILIKKLCVVTVV
jgi:hypothetical protein